MIQFSCFEDIELHKKYNYIILFLSHINIRHPGNGFNLDGKIRATQFLQKKQDEHSKSEITANPIIKLPSDDHFGLTPAKEERLSEIMAAPMATKAAKNTTCVLRKMFSPLLCL